MNEPRDEKRKAHLNVGEADHKVTDALVQGNNPEWKQEDGECPSCVSLAHELSDPTHIPKEITDQTGKF